MMKRKRKNGEEELSRVIRIQGREEVRAQALLRSSWYHLLRIVYIPFVCLRTKIILARSVFHEARCGLDRRMPLPAKGTTTAQEVMKGSDSDVFSLLGAASYAFHRVFSNPSTQYIEEI